MLLIMASRPIRCLSLAASDHQSDSQNDIQSPVADFSPSELSVDDILQEKRTSRVRNVLLEGFLCHILNKSIDKAQRISLVRSD